MRRIRVALSLALILAAGCRRTETHADLPTRNSVVWWQLSDITRLNPYLSPDANASYAYSLIWEPLNNTDPRTLESIPWLASLPRISEDHKTYWFQLDPAALWSDGIPVRSADVVFSFKAALNPLLVNGQQIRGSLSLVDSVSIIDSTQFAVHMHEAYSYMERFVFCGYLAVLPKHVFDPKNLTDRISWQELKQDAPKNPAVHEWATFFEDAQHDRDPRFLIGSGPYQLKEWVTNDHLTIERTKRSWSANKAWGEAYVQEIVFKTISDQNAAVTALKSKELDVMDAVPAALFRSLDTTKLNYIRKDTIYTNQYTFIAWNNARPLFQDKRVRRALSMLVDKQSMIHSLLYDGARSTDGPIVFSQIMYSPASHPVTFDVEQAKSLLKEAGWVDSDNDGVLDKLVNGKRTPFRFTFTSVSGNELVKQILLIVSEQLRKVGIEASIQPLEASVYLENLHDHNFDASFSAFNGNVPEDDLYTVWHSDQAKNKGANSFSFSNREADSLLVAARKEFDKTKRYELLKRFQEIVREEQPVTFLWAVPVRLARLDRFDNVELFHMPPCFAVALWVVRGAGVEPKWSSTSTVMKKQ